MKKKKTEKKLVKKKRFFFTEKTRLEKNVFFSNTRPCTPAKVSTHVQSQTKLLPPLNGKTVYHQDVTHLLYLAKEALKQMAGRPFEGRPALYLHDKPCKPLPSGIPPQPQEWGIQTSAPTLRAMATLKLSESRSDPSDETSKALS